MYVACMFLWMCWSRIHTCTRCLVFTDYMYVCICDQYIQWNIHATYMNCQENNQMSNVLLTYIELIVLLLLNIENKLSLNCTHLRFEIIIIYIAKDFFCYGWNYYIDYGFHYFGHNHSIEKAKKDSSVLGEQLFKRPTISWKIQWCEFQIPFCITYLQW